MSYNFARVDKILQQKYAKSPELPYQQIKLSRLYMYTHCKWLEARNRLYKKYNINETLFSALMMISAQNENLIQPSELSALLGSSRTNVTRVSDELLARGWIEREINHQDRRSQKLILTAAGEAFLAELMPFQHALQREFWDVLNPQEQQQFEHYLKRLLAQLDVLEQQSQDEQ